MSIKQLSFKEDALSGFGIIFQSLENLLQFTVCLQLFQFYLRSQIVISMEKKLSLKNSFCGCFKLIRQSLILTAKIFLSAHQSLR